MITSAPRARGLALALLAAALGGACGDDDAPPVGVILDPAAATSGDPTRFFDLPFPSDVRRTADGRPDLASFPAQSPVVAAYATAVTERLDGFGLNAGAYFRFDGELDPASLPEPAASDDVGASVYLVDVTPDSPTYGERTPASVHFTATGYTTTGPDVLAVWPYPGFPLRESTTYAVVVTDRVRDVTGDRLESSRAWDQVRGATPGYEAYAATLAPLWTTLAEFGLDDPEAVIAATVFTTQRFTDLLPAMRKVVWSRPAPQAARLTRTSEAGSMRRYEGTYKAPNFQRGEVPYSNAGGDVELDAAGLPIVQRTETLRFAVTVPDGPTPASGWPIVLYEHGTGGDYLSFVDDGTARSLADAGLAAISIDQVMHGPRNPGGNPELDFFNFINPLTARDNVAQGAADGFALTRLATGLRFLDDGREVFFDPERVYFFGHSQGATTGGPFLPFEPSIKAAVMSGAGGAVYLTLLHKTEPLDIPAVVLTIARDEPLDEWNPTLALLQTWLERADAVNYGPLLVREPPVIDSPGGEAQGPKAVIQTDGLVDHYAPNINGHAYFVAVGGDLVGPQLEAIDGLALRGRSRQSVPLSDNLDGTTAALVQFAADEGHFVVFNDPTARRQTTYFLATHAATGTATVLP